jgi:hypothetical protein
MVFAVMMMGVFTAGVTFAAANQQAASKWTEIFFPDGFKFYLVDKAGKSTEQSVSEDRPPILYEGRMYFSIRELTDLLGLNLVYDGDNKTVHIYEGEIPAGKEEKPATSTKPAVEQNDIDKLFNGEPVKLPETIKDPSTFGNLKPISFKDKKAAAIGFNLGGYQSLLLENLQEYKAGKKTQSAAISYHKMFAEELQADLDYLKGMKISEPDGFNMLYYVNEFAKASWVGVNDSSIDEDELSSYSKPFHRFTVYKIYLQLKQNGIPLNEMENPLPGKSTEKNPSGQPQRTNKDGQETPRI